MFLTKAHTLLTSLWSKGRITQFNRFSSQPISVREILQSPPSPNPVKTWGWIRSVRYSGEKFAFISLSDGSCHAPLQIFVEGTHPSWVELKSKGKTGVSLEVTGRITASPGRNEKQTVEMQAEEIALVGACDPDHYPLSKKFHSMEHLRSLAHLRSRTQVGSAAARVRSRALLATHTFFQEQGYFNVATPVLTGSDCEGAGEAFVVKPVDQRDFFGRQAYLTVSGQLQAEAYACGMGRVYTLGPTFRAEDSATRRHLAEFWMLEPEAAFLDLPGLLQLAEGYVRAIVTDSLKSCAEDVAYLTSYEAYYAQHQKLDAPEKPLQTRLQEILAQPFAQETYTNCIEILATQASHLPPLTWGMDLSSDHERFLAETVFKRPLFVTHYPKTLKPFYMRASEDGRTVACVDLLVPGLGELIGGSVREERYDELLAAMTERKMDLEAYSWYTDLRRFGTVPHAGFGVGFERLVMLLTGLPNIRDVIPFPRYPGALPC